MAPKEKKAEKAEKPVAEEKAAPAKAEKGEKEKAPQKPNEEEYKKRTDEISKKIDEKKKEMTEISKKIDELTQGGEEFTAAKQKLFESLEAVKLERGDLLEKRSAIQKQKQAQREEDRNAKRTMKDLEKKIEMTEDQIDDEIQKIEYKMSTSSMSLKEEKDCMVKIKKLKAKKPEVAQHTKEYERMKAQCDTNTMPDPSRSHEEQITEISGLLDACKARSDEIFGKITALKEQRAKKNEGASEWIEKKKALKEAIDKFVAERRAVNEEKRNALDAWYEWDRSRREEQRKAREAERKRADAEWEKQKAERELEKPNPFLNETTLLTQTIDYCKGLLPKTDCDKEEDKKEVNHVNPEGAKVLVSKKDRDVEMYFAATKKKALKKKGGESKANQKVKHTAATFAIFKELNVDAPMTVEEVGPLMEKLQASLATFNDKVATWESERKDRIEAAKASAAAAGEADAETAEPAE